jgi:hypothetical protein
MKQDVKLTKVSLSNPSRDSKTITGIYRIFDELNSCFHYQLQNDWFLYFITMSDGKTKYFDDADYFYEFAASSDHMVSQTFLREILFRDFGIVYEQDF